MFPFGSIWWTNFTHIFLQLLELEDMSFVEPGVVEIWTMAPICFI